MTEVLYRDEKGRYLSKITPSVTQYTLYHDDAERDFTIRWTDRGNAAFGYAPAFNDELDLLMRLGYRMSKEKVNSTPVDNPRGLREEDVRRLPPKSVSRMNLPSHYVAALTINGVKTDAGEVLGVGEILALGDSDAIKGLCRRARNGGHITDSALLTEEQADLLLAWRTGLSIVFLPLVGPSEPTILASYHNVDWLRGVLASVIEDGQPKSEYSRLIVMDLESGNYEIDSSRDDRGLDVT